ncbi:hypothetical protein [Providencia sp.]|uniref:hypothetical protein n=1 Tax=Providencia sp. TaxID=589 RepID=UPI00333F94F8
MLPLSKFNSITRILISNSQINRTASSIANQATRLKNDLIDFPRVAETPHNHGKKKTNDAIDLLKMQPNKKNRLPTTIKKTVHLNDIQILKKNMSSKINDLNNRITPLISNNEALHPNDIIEMQSEFNSIVICLNDCQILLNNSSYPHHKRKQKILTSLKNQMLKIEYQLTFEKFITEKKYAVPLHIK